MNPDHAHLKINSVATAFGFGLLLLTNHVMGFSLINFMLCIFLVHIQWQIQTGRFVQLHIYTYILQSYGLYIYMILYATKIHWVFGAQ